MKYALSPAALALVLLSGLGAACVVRTAPQQPGYTTNPNPSNSGYNGGGSYASNDLVYQAQQAANAGDTYAALDLLNQAAAEDERNPEIYRLRASIAIQGGSLGIACQDLKKYRYFSGNASAQIQGISDAQCNGGDYGGSYSAGTTGGQPDNGMITTSADLTPEQAVREAETALDAGDEIKAMVFLDQAEKKAPNNPDMLRLRAVSYERIGEIDKACSAMKAYISVAGSAGPVALKFSGYIKSQNSKQHPNCR